MKREKRKVKSTKNGISARHKSSVIGKYSTAGITLIALVITIIVLLILAGITINLTIGQDGILKRAEQAGRNYTNAADYERTQLAEFTNTADDIIADVTGKTLASKARPGDYIAYTPATRTFSMTPEQTGQDANQNFNTSDYKGLWQVLYNDEEHGLQIISAGSVGTLTLGHADTDGSGITRTAEDEEKVIRAYNNAVDTLNSFCRNYVDTAYATSGRSVGSNPLSPDDTVTDTVTLPFTPGGFTPDWTTTETGCKVNDTNYLTDYKAMQTATLRNENGINDIDEGYWLASRYGGSLTYYYVIFCIRWVNGEGMAGYYTTKEDSAVWGINSDGRTWPEEKSYGVRPVITLNSKIQTSGGDGSKTNPFTLMAM